MPFHPFLKSVAFYYDAAAILWIRIVELLSPLINAYSDLSVTVCAVIIFADLEYPAGLDHAALLNVVKSSVPFDEAGIPPVCICLRVFVIVFAVYFDHSGSRLRSLSLGSLCLRRLGSGFAAFRKSVLHKLLGEEGLGYGNKPKGVLRFHRYPKEVRTAIAEHLVEAQKYMRNADGSCNLTVTISPEHRELFENAIAEVQEAYEKRYGVRYNIRFTYQDKATDTIAVDPQNKPFRKEDGSLLFRPAGHGALIHNLNQVEDELVSIKNIDNVSHEKLLPVTAEYKQVLMGVALQLRDKIFGYLEQLDAQPSVQLCNEIEQFLDKILCVQLPLAHSEKERVQMLHSKLNRPIRVCGMVKNEGEPGGGPYIIAGKDGCTSLQILESVQINKADTGAMEAMSRATHFNPVDLVCCLRNYKGQRFDLLQYVDHDAGFMSSKSFEGRELKALELPGLWNGAMSDWNTLFVEVPIETFNPVKVVLDLLRPAHQA